MNVYEQQARALKEIAAELKGIRRAFDIIVKNLKPDDEQGETLADALATLKVDQSVEREEEDVYMCGFYGGECDQKHPGFCSDPCDYRYKESEYDG